VAHWTKNNVVFLPDYRLTMDISSFTFHKNIFFKEMYLAEPNPHLEFTFISIANRIYSIWDIDFLFGLGNLPDDVVFSVLGVAFGIAPAIELRYKPLYLRSGLDHRCFHEVDRKNFSIVHWNAVYAAVASPNFRYGDYWKPLAVSDGWTFKNRFGWQFVYNFYLKRFGRLATPEKLNGNNPRIGDISTQCKFSVYRRRSWIVNVQGMTLLGLQDVNSVQSAYWRTEAGFETHFRRGVKGATFYMKYILDDMPLVDNKPRFSKDRLLQFGFRFFD
jgi:hypothetical protein